jgi:tetratricopeptide (TPR) repeat protein
MPRGGVSGNKGGSGRPGNTGNKGGSGKEGNKGGSGSPGNKGGAAAAGNTNASSAETKARRLYLDGEQLHRHGNLTAAHEKYVAALKIDPELSDAHNNIAMILASRYRLYAAGDRPAGLYSIICEHFEKGAVGGCSASLSNLCAFRFEGENGSMSDPDETLEDCRFIMGRMKPVTGAEHHLFARSLLVVACCTKDRDEALLKSSVDHFRLAVAADPSSIIFQTTLGSILASRGNCLEACKIFKAIVKIRPRYQFALDMFEKLKIEVLCVLPTCPIAD